MTRAISVRLDDEARRRLRSTGGGRTQSLRCNRRAVIEAARRLESKKALAAEVAALEASDDDRREMLGLAAVMESLRAPG